MLNLIHLLINSVGLWINTYLSRVQRLKWANADKHYGDKCTWTNSLANQDTLGLLAGHDSLTGLGASGSVWQHSPLRATTTAMWRMCPRDNYLHSSSVGSAATQVLLFHLLPFNAKSKLTSIPDATMLWSSSSSKYNCCLLLHHSTLTTSATLMNADALRVSHECLVDSFSSGDESVNSTSNKIKLLQPPRQRTWVVQPIQLSCNHKPLAGPRFNYTMPLTFHTSLVLPMILLATTSVYLHRVVPVCEHRQPIPRHACLMSGSTVADFGGVWCRRSSQPSC